MASGVIAGLDLWRWPALALNARNEQAVLTGNHFDLVIEEVAVNITGRPAIATAINGSVPGPLLRWREGDTVTLSVTNRLREQTSVHWHGVRSPADMDGVPGLSFPGIDPGATFVYRIPVRQYGTYWYHSHSAFQEQTGHYAPLIIERRDKDPIQFDREYVIMLSDWTDQNPEMVLSNLKQQSSYYNFHQRTIGNFLSDARKGGLGATLSDRLMWGAMNMSPTDILDVSGATYTYLLNGLAPAANWTGLFKPGERVRLRFINASSMTIFDVRIPGLAMTVVQADGNDVEPVDVDEFRISVAETYDLIVQPNDWSAFTIFAQSEDRTGYARGTLAPRAGVVAAIPPMDPRPMRTMADMGMGSMPGMEMGHPSSKLQSVQPSPGHAEGDMGSMPGMEMATPKPSPSIGQSHLPVANPVQLQLGPEVDHVAETTTDRLAEPGAGLEGNGRRILTYANLRARYRGADPRPPDREFEFHLTGNMERFIWGFNGRTFSQNAPIRLKLGERVRFVLINDTMMEHPIHLHGLWSELENGNGEYRPYKHTLNVKPAERLSFLVSADTPGHWAFHCHLFFHMETGMFLTVIVS
ncbi:copper resistance system multicopper oxidase [Candidatus Binatus sp.]|uniref:copper resistance system multicopper oxidase n=1 Tax=Candidatus Binatus sp. TaxID=2811406 RepID=UPI00351CD7D2